MDSLWRTVLWAQFGAAIDMLDNAVVACPDALWRQSLWPDPPDHSLPPGRTEFWYIAYHALFWLDLYLFGSEEGFMPPAPYALVEQDDTGPMPERPYTKDELRAYLAYARHKCKTTLETLTDERARQLVDFPWVEGQAVSYIELQIYSMRHVQEHAAQLNLLLGRHGVADEAIDWVARAERAGSDR